MYYTEIMRKLSTLIVPKTIKSKGFIKKIEKTEKQFIKKRTKILNNGVVCKQVYYLLEGIIVMYRHCEKGKLHISRIWVAGDIFTETESFFNGTKSDFIIEAVVDCEVVCQTKEDFCKIRKHKVTSMLVEKVLLIEKKKDQDLLILRTKPAVERVREFKKLYPKNDVPHKYAASFVSVTESTYSKLNKKINALK